VVERKNMPWDEIKIKVGKHATFAVSVLTLGVVLLNSVTFYSDARQFYRDVNRHMRNDITYPEMSRWCVVYKFDPKVLREIHEEYQNETMAE